MIIYKITNKITNKSYIGYTKRSIEQRWHQHCADASKCPSTRKFYNAIRKYGSDCWSLEVIDTAIDVSEAKLKEVQYIAENKTYDHGYNSTRGGDGNNGIVMSQESNRKRSAKLTGVKKSASTVEKFRQRRQSDETKKKISLAHKGKSKPWVKWSAEQCRARGLIRRALTEEQYREIHRLRVTGMTIRNISAQLSLTPDLVKKWLRMDW